MRRALTAVLVTALATTACTSTAVEPGATGPVAGASTATTPGPSSGPASGADFESDLRRTLTAPPLPSFSIPTDVLAGAQGRQMSDQLELPPGLYQGIAVLDARCTDAGTAATADAGGALRGGTHHFEDEVVSITVAGDGTGVYDSAGVHVAVLADGGGVYDDGSTRVSVAADGSGTYSSGDLRYTVRPDGSGLYDDGDLRVWVDAAGAGGYDDGTMRLSWQPTGDVFGDGAPGRLEAVRSVLADGLPRFPPVPRVEAVEPTGVVCGTVIRLDANVLFDVDRADVSPEGEAHLRRVAALLAALGSPRAQVNGHTDSVGSHAHNRELSDRRAATVRDLLVQHGVAGDSLRTRGLGESQPLRPETGPDGAPDTAAQQLNRRVEIVLLDQG